jgi:hypothetical protein
MVWNKIKNKLKIQTPKSYEKIIGAIVVQFPGGRTFGHFDKVTVRKVYFFFFKTLKLYFGYAAPPGVNFINILWAAFVPKNYKPKL